MNAPVIVSKLSPQPGDELVFLPLGGAGEIGMNLNAYGYGPAHDREWIIVDVGVTFGGDDTPGVEIITPDPGFLADGTETIRAIILTHAHEDHIGAIGWLWSRFKAPVYATPFTAALVRDKLRERGVIDKVPLNEIPLQHRFQIGPFDLEMVTITHSIPEPNGLAVHTPLGTVLHTGDWKIDPDPLIGAVTDDARIRELGEAGVLAMVCDSTNVFTPGTSGSEADVRRELTRVIAAQKGKVAVACFASNVARLESVIRAAEACGRHVCLVGRSMFRITGAAKSVGLLKGCADFIEAEHAAYLPPESLLYLCTGSQGEPRAALSRIAAGTHPHVSLGAGDSLLFSSRQIPGNERAIHDMQAAFIEKGVSVITDRDEPIHVSGHPARDELAEMYGWARPQIAIPVHGERRHILEHAKFAKGLQVPFAFTPRNGDLMRLAPGEPEVIDEVPSGRLHVDGERLVPADGDALRDRKRMAHNGHVTVTLAVDAKGKLRAGPDVRTAGLAESSARDGEKALDLLCEAAEQAFARMKPQAREDEDLIEDMLQRAVRKAAERIWDRRPLVDVVVLSI
jgi:ribonuclease J